MCSQEQKTKCDECPDEIPEEKVYRKQPFRIVYRKTKRLEEITAEDIPPGLTPKDIAKA